MNKTTSNEDVDNVWGEDVVIGSQAGLRNQCLKA